MKCTQARRLFGAYWDDDATQAEREWLESHFLTCAACRREYEEYGRALEWLAALPRVEAAPDLAERTLQRARRTAPAPDRVPTAGVPWVPVTAAAALILLVVTLISPWAGLVSSRQEASRQAAGSPPSQPEQVAAVPAAPQPSVPEPTLEGSTATVQLPVIDLLAGVPDSLFDHEDDVEFVLDPVTVQRGRASLSRRPAGAQAKQAIITF